MQISIDGKPVCDIKWHNNDCMGDTDLHESIAGLIRNKISEVESKHE
tara:strand:- start:41 stop:181 length:141 start_codon:yes stop_codon:yes gene_type:complete